MKIAVFGAGYVGLVQAAVLADAGHHLWCADINVDRVERLSEGVVDIFEPGLEELVGDGIRSGRLQFTSDLNHAVQKADVLFIAVGTPLGDDGAADTTQVFSVSQSIAQTAQAEKIVALKSTVPVGTTDKVSVFINDELAKRGKKFNVYVASNPEFLKEGAAVADCQRPDRIVIGTDSEVVINTLREVYAPYNRNREKIMVMDARSAELTKYAANCMLATKISFMNEMANIAERVGADIESVRKGIGADPRIGYHYIYPGCGYGGSCLPKDVRALITTATEIGYSPELIKAVDSVNKRQKNRLFEMVYDYYQGELEGKIIAIWGLSFKPNTNDIREAPSCILVERLWQSGAYVKVYDPEAAGEFRKLYGVRPDTEIVLSREDVLEGASALIVCTEWNEFRALDMSSLLEKMEKALIIDGRNLYDPNFIRSQGVDYRSVGKR